MNDRVNPFATIKDPPVFTTKPTPEKPVEEEAIARIAEENRFPSRQATKPAKIERRKPRIYRTGRNQQFNAKATAETINKIYKLADERKVPLVELLKLAMDALEREGMSHQETCLSLVITAQFNLWIIVVARLFALIFFQDQVARRGICN